MADPAIGEPLLAALAAGGGLEIWQAGTVWKCPGCGDRTLRTEEFLEGLRRAEIYLRRQEMLQQREDTGRSQALDPVFAWLTEVSARLLGCERDRVYIHDETGPCTYDGQTYISRI